MANELNLSVSLIYLKNALTVNQGVSGLKRDVGGSGVHSLTSYTASTSDTALPLGDVAIAGGYLLIINTDASNYVKLKTAVSGTEFSRILPGDIILLRLAPGITAPSVQANSSACILKYVILDL